MILKITKAHVQHTLSMNSSFRSSLLVAAMALQARARREETKRAEEKQSSQLRAESLFSMHTHVKQALTHTRVESRCNNFTLRAPTHFLQSCAEGIQCKHGQQWRPGLPPIALHHASNSILHLLN